MKNIKIIIATHKKYEMPKDDMYIPLHVGKAGKRAGHKIDFCILITLGAFEQDFPDGQRQKGASVHHQGFTGQLDGPSVKRAPTVNQIDNWLGVAEQIDGNPREHQRHIFNSRVHGLRRPSLIFHGDGPRHGRIEESNHC